MFCTPSQSGSTLKGKKNAHLGVDPMCKQLSDPEKLTGINAKYNISFRKKAGAVN